MKFKVILSRLDEYGGYAQDEISGVEEVIVTENGILIFLSKKILRMFDEKEFISPVGNFILNADQVIASYTSMHWLQFWRVEDDGTSGTDNPTN